MECTAILNKLYDKLEDYLICQGVDINSQGFFRCIHPDHPDRNPSASVAGKAPYNGRVFHCFSGGGGHDGNIFTAAHWLENMPIHGHEFWTVTVANLCKRYDIPFEPMEISEDEKRRYQRLNAYQDATNVISKMAFDSGVLRESHVGVKHLLDRGITEQSIKDWKIGVITSYKDYVDAMAKLGWTDEAYLQSINLLAKDLFNRDSFIIPINDATGRPVGFVTRNVRLNPNDKGHMKYVNSVNSDIYRKGSILFGYNQVKKLSGPLYIVEGYIDAIYLQQCGISKVVAIGSTVLTEEHRDMLFNDNQSDVIMCLDGDQGGYNGTRIAIERLAEYTRFNVKIAELPFNEDPDTYVRNNGAEAFQKLPLITPFRWSLNHSDYSEDLTVLAQKVIPTIVSETSSITRLQMIKELSIFANIPEMDIRRDVDMQLSKADDAYLKELSEINQYAQVQLTKKRILDTKAILRDAIAKVEIIDEKYNGSKDHRGDFYNSINEMESKIMQGDFKHGLISPKFKGIESTLDGIPFWNCLTFLAGRPSAGKTALLNALSLDIIEHNEDASIFYMSIDDNTQLLMQKIIAVKSGLSTAEIKAYDRLTSEQRDRFHDAMSWLKGVSDRYIIVDATHGNTLNSFENHVNWYVKEFEGSKKLFLLDNFHKLNTSNLKTSDKKDAISEACSHIKLIGQINDLSIISTVELRKLAQETARPTRQDMQGSNKLDYDADIIGLVHNDMNVNKDTRLVHTVQINGGPATAMPWIELDIAKNKINGRTEMQAFKYNKHNMRFEEGSMRDFVRLRDATSKNTGYSQAF